MKTVTVLILLQSLIMVIPAQSESSPEMTDGSLIETEMLTTCGRAGVGEQAPWFSGWTLDGHVFNVLKPFSDGNADRLVLVFWATWCSPCRLGLQRLIGAAELFEEARISVALVNLGEQESVILDFFNGRKPNYPIVLDPFQNSAEAYLVREDGSLTLPVTALIGKEGTIESLMGAEGDDYIKRILTGSK